MVAGVERSHPYKRISEDPVVTDTLKPLGGSQSSMDKAQARREVSHGGHEGKAVEAVKGRAMKAIKG